MELKVLLAAIAILQIAFAAKDDYCDPSLCDDGLTHIACDQDQVCKKYFTNISLGEKKLFETKKLKFVFRSFRETVATVPNL